MAAVLELKPIPGTDAPPPATQPSVLDMVKAAIESGVDLGQLTAIYLKLRNAKKDIDEQAKTKTSPLVSAMDAIEAHLLAKFRDMGIDSIKTDAGTPYISEKSSVTVADNEAWITWVLNKAIEPLEQLQAEARQIIVKAMLDSGAFALLEARASKSAVEAYLEEKKELPPGLNRRVESTINVRAS